MSLLSDDIKAHAGRYGPMACATDEWHEKAKVLEALIRGLGACPECLQVQLHAVTEPISTCACGSSEDYGARPLQQLRILRAWRYVPAPVNQQSDTEE